FQLFQLCVSSRSPAIPSLRTFPTRRSSDLAPPPEKVRATPLVRRLAQELGVDLDALTGTGPQGRITEQDVRGAAAPGEGRREPLDRKSTRLNSSHVAISYAVFCLKKKKEWP